MKILWHSVHPAVGTGYGQQTATFLPRIRDLGHDVAISSFYGLQSGFGITRWNDMIVYPADHTALNKFILRTYVEDHAAGGELTDVQVITLMDVWTWMSMQHGGHAAYDGLRIASWVPIDHCPMPPLVRAALKEFDVTPIAMSRFGEEQLRIEGFDPLYVPHGIDTEAFKPRPDEAAELRERLEIPEDGFVVGMVANNQGDSPPRKAFPQVIQAFSALHERHPNSYLYLHTEMKGLFNSGIDLVAILAQYSVPDEAVRIVDQAKYMIGMIPPERLARAYSMMDVLANPSYGEGFGIPIIEAQACGTPVIVTNWTAMPELCGAGWIVEGEPWPDHCGASFMYPPVHGVYDAMVKALDARGDQEIRERARKFALQYDADRVLDEFWKPTLDALEKWTPPVPEVKPNRKQRRAQRTKAAA